MFNGIILHRDNVYANFLKKSLYGYPDVLHIGWCKKFFYKFSEEKDNVDGNYFHIRNHSFNPRKNIGCLAPIQSKIFLDNFNAIKDIVMTFLVVLFYLI